MAPAFPNVTVLNHPLVQHKLDVLRRKATSTSEFRQLMRELSLLMAYEVTRDLPTGTVAIETPMEAMQAPLLSGKKLCFLSILRAGNGMVEGMLDLVRLHAWAISDCPRSCHAGAGGILSQVPRRHSGAAGDRCRSDGGDGSFGCRGDSPVEAGRRFQISFACLIAAPEGLGALADVHPGLPVYVAAIDRQLDQHGYICPGLGDAGDRLYGTR